MSSMRNGLWIGLTILAVACGGGNEPAESPATPAGAPPAGGDGVWTPDAPAPSDEPAGEKPTIWMPGMD